MQDHGSVFEILFYRCGSPAKERDIINAGPLHQQRLNPSRSPEFQRLWLAFHALTSMAACSKLLTWLYLPVLTSYWMWSRDRHSLLGCMPHQTVTSLPEQTPIFFFWHPTKSWGFYFQSHTSVWKYRANLQSCRENLVGRHQRRPRRVRQEIVVRDEHKWSQCIKRSQWLSLYDISVPLIYRVAQKVHTS